MLIRVALEAGRSKFEFHLYHWPTYMISSMDAVSPGFLIYYNGYDNTCLYSWCEELGMITYVKLQSWY